MNSLTIIGNCVKDAELRTTQTGIPVCSFTVAVNNRKNKDDDATFFRVSAWRKLGENCGKYITKGMKVCVIGEVGLDTYQAKDGTNRSALSVTANDVEFLSRGSENTVDNSTPEPVQQSIPTGYTAVDNSDDLPF